MGNEALSSTLDSLSTAAGGVDSASSAAFEDNPQLAAVAIAAGIVAAAATGLVLSAAIPEIAAGYSLTIAATLFGTDVTSGEAARALASTLSAYLTADIATLFDYEAGSPTASAVEALGQFATLL